MIKKKKTSTKAKPSMVERLKKVEKKQNDDNNRQRTSKSIGRIKFDFDATFDRDTGECIDIKSSGRQIENISTEVFIRSMSAFVLEMVGSVGSKLGCKDRLLQKFLNRIQVLTMKELNLLDELPSSLKDFLKGL